ncbi:hypothetical protein [Streptomyces sp. GESEQ-35]|uniref:hypothetical protein n=1 Tax=Streptomyces sp. GESEQ-35 TaxID=2812657 RepID=UPI001B31CE56|nr:hypothetical protein [Streptomyces sp. GESEQ-35]
MRSTAAKGIAVACAAVLLTGCVSAGIEIETGRSDPDPDSHPSFASSSATTSTPAEEYFGPGDCATPDPVSGEGIYREVACDDPSATAEVLEPIDTGTGLGLTTPSDCPESTDFILDLAQNLAGVGATATDEVMPSLFACMRNLTSSSDAPS